MGVFGCFGFGMSSRLMRCSLNSSRRGKGMACLAFGNSFLFSFHGAHVYSRKRREKKKLVSRVLWNPKVLPPQLLTEAKAKPINSYIFDHMSMNHTVPFMYQVDDAMSHMVTRESWPHSPNPYACPVCCRDVATVAPDRKAWCRDM